MSSSDNYKSFKDILSFWLGQSGWTMYKLAKESGLSISTINNIFARDTEPTYSVICKIAQGFGISLSEFFYCCSDKQHFYTKDEYDVFELYSSLSRSDKKLVKAYIMGISHIT